MDFLRAEFEPDFSFSVSSSRAIPFERLAMEASDITLMAKPVKWGLAQPGMSPSEDEVDDTEKSIFWPTVVADLGGYDVASNAEWITKRQCVERLWELGGQLDVRIARAMVELTGVHKSIPNRQIESHVHVHCLATATTRGWMNFFGLRLDKAADPTLRALAEEAWRGWNESVPRKLEPGQWHLPYADDPEENEQIWVEANGGGIVTKDQEEIFIKVSVARCAHLSYESFASPGRRMSIEECIALHDRFVNSVPMHASPMEHIAAADELIDGNWKRKGLGGNLGDGWIQYRKLLANESIAPLPAQYL